MLALENDRFGKEGSPCERKSQRIARIEDRLARGAVLTVLRPAVPADLSRLLAIRDGSGIDALSDSALVTEPLLRRLIAAGSVMVWDEAGHVVGFSASDDGAIHLLVDPTHRGKGIGRDLLAAACAMLKETGHAAATLALAAGSTAGRHYRAAGWRETGRTSTGGSVLKKPL
jgi:GNAT superfamily N-acetyltransferase